MNKKPLVEAMNWELSNCFLSGNREAHCQEERIDLTHLLEEDDEDEIKNTSDVESKEDHQDLLQCERIDLTHLLEEDDEDEIKNTSDVESKEDHQDLLQCERIDLTHLLEEDDEDEINNTSDVESNEDHQDLLQCETNLGIPQDKLSYILYPPKIVSDVSSPCHCTNDCNKKLEKIKDMIKKIQAVRLTYCTIKQGHLRTSKLIELVNNSRVLRESSRVYQHTFDGVLFCINKWTEIVHISLATYYRIVNLINTGVVVKEKIPKLSKRNCRGLQVCGFINVVLDKYAEYSPVNGRRILPPVITRKFLWKEYEEHAEKKPGEKKVSQHHFFKIFRETFDKDVSFAKQKYINPCSVCLVAASSLETIRDPEAKKSLKEDLTEHLDRQRKERLDYYSKREKAISSPKECMSIIIDGMDQAKTGIPHFRGWARPKEAKLYLKTHITGTIVHGKGNFFYIDCNEYPHDPNLTATCLINTLYEQKTGDHLPPTLYIQCDNCGRENKNKVVLSFLAYLCLKGYVKDVFLSFLMKGHTHEDIDQRFSTISQHLRKVNAMTMTSLVDEITKAFLSKCHIEQMGTVWDIREWIGDCINTIQYHSYAHQFWLTVDSPGHVTMKARLWSTDDWYPSADEDPIELLLYDQYDKQCIPTGIPSVVDPDFEKLELPNFLQTIKKMRSHLNHQQHEHWTQFCQNPHIKAKKRRVWPLSSILPVHKIITLPRQVNLSVTDIHDFIEEERSRPQIKTKKRKRKD